MNADFPDIGYLGGNQTLALFCFLIFLYSRKQERTLETQSALQTFKDTEEDSSWEHEFIREIKKSDKFDIFMKLAMDDDHEKDITLIFECV